MANDPPYSTGIFETIVDVHFDDKLAVEFFDNPARSSLEGAHVLPDMNKGLISLWVRAGAASIRAVHARDLAGSSHTLLRGVLPFITFGALQPGYEIISNIGPEVPIVRRDALQNADGSLTIFFDEDTTYNSGPVLTKDEHTVDPSYIGLRIDEEDDGSLTAALDIRLQVNTFGSGRWVYTRPTFSESSYASHFFSFYPAATVHDAWDFGLEFCLTQAYLPDWEHFMHFGDVDETALNAAKDGPDVFSYGGEINFTLNHWHHLLISFDLTKNTVGRGEYGVQDWTGCVGTPSTRVDRIKAISKPCTLYIAFDDVNRTGKAINDGTTGLGPNGIAPDNALEAARTAFSTQTRQTSWGNTGEYIILTRDAGGMPTYTYRPGVIPGSRLAVPVLSQLLDAMADFEVAELQFFPGKVVNTASKSIRRLFISDAGKPVNPKVAAKAFGTKPALLLHGVKNWQEGKNTGAGSQPVQLTPRGIIEPYKPQPSLRGPQGEAQ